MSKLHDFEGLSLRAGEVELLRRAREADLIGAWQTPPEPALIIAVIERLGRTRAAREDDPNWRARCEIAEARAASIEQTASRLLANIRHTRDAREDGA